MTPSPVLKMTRKFIYIYIFQVLKIIKKEKEKLLCHLTNSFHMDSVTRQKEQKCPHIDRIMWTSACVENCCLCNPMWPCYSHIKHNLTALKYVAFTSLFITLQRKHQRSLFHIHKRNLFNNKQLINIEVGIINV